MRVVNVVDLMCLFIPQSHPHGMDQTRFVDLFTADKPVVFAFHGYQRAIHEIIHGRVNPQRFHVRGFNEQGTTTTPFDMVVLNSISRFHLAALALKRVPRFRQRADALIAELENDIRKAIAYSASVRGSGGDRRVDVDGVELGPGVDKPGAIVAGSGPIRRRWNLGERSASGRSFYRASCAGGRGFR